jgi:hypothetical protein
VIAGEELPATEFVAMLATVLARVVIPSEQERIRDLTPEAIGDMHVPDEANYGRTWNTP